MPEHDIRPHGRIVKTGEYQFDSHGSPKCDCKPDIITGDSDNGMYDHPLVVHHSFENKDILEKSLASNYPGLLD